MITIAGWLQDPITIGAVWQQFSARIITRVQTANYLGPCFFRDKFEKVKWTLCVCVCVSVCVCLCVCVYEPQTHLKNRLASGKFPFAASEECASWSSTKSLLMNQLVTDSKEIQAGSPCHCNGRWFCHSYWFMEDTMSVETLLAIFLHQTSTGLGSRKKNIVHNSKAQDGSLNRAVNYGAGAFIPTQSHRKYSFLLSAILEKGGR